MKQGKFGNLVDLAREVVRQNDEAHDAIVNTKDIEVSTKDNVPQMFSPTSDIGQPIKAHALHQMGTHFKVPRAYIDRMREHAPSLLNDNLNHWLQAEPSDRMIRALDGNVRAFMSNKYKRIDNAPVLATVLEQIEQHPGVVLKSCDVTDNRMYLKLVSPKLEGEIKRGDPIQMGISIGNSEIGLGSFTIQGLIYRLVCENGMISAFDYGEGIRRRHLGKRQIEGVMASADTLEAEAHALALHARDAIAQLLSPESFQKHLQAFQETTERKITGDVVKSVEVLGKTLGFTQEEGGGILRHLIEGADLTQYGLLNAVTRFAQDVDSYDRSTELESIGGKIITLRPSQWKSIAEAA